MRIRWATLLLVAVACGGGQKGDTVGHEGSATPDAAPAPPSSDLPDDLIRAVESEIAVLERIADGARAAADCDGIEANLRAIADGPDGQMMGKAGQHPAYVTHQAEIETRYMPRIDAALGVLITAITPCAEHAGLQDVMTKLGF
jgi:hypothetical protein